MRKTTLVILLVIGFGTMTRAQHVAVPSWFSATNYPDASVESSHALAPYSGVWDKAERYWALLMGLGFMTGNQTEGQVAVFWKVESPTLYTYKTEKTGSPASEIGFATGLHKVLWVSTSTDPAGAIDKLLVCGIDTAGDAIIKSVSFDGNSQIPNTAATTILGPVSGKTLCRAGIVGSYLYTFVPFRQTCTI